MKYKGSNKKSLLIISKYFHPEEFVINDFAKEFFKKGYEVKVLTQSPSYPYDKIFKGYKNNFFQKYEYKNIKVYAVKNLLGNNKGFIRKTFSYLFFSFISSLYLLKCIGHTKHIFIFHCSY